MARPKGVVIQGVRFRPGEVDWEDAHSTTRGKLPDFDAMRNGSTRQGKLVDLIGGDTVRWRNPGGDTQDVPIRESARVYLNVDASRTIFNYKPTAAPDPEPQMPSGGIEVRATDHFDPTSWAVGVVGGAGIALSGVIAIIEYSGTTRAASFTTGGGIRGPTHQDAIT